MTPAERLIARYGVAFVREIAAMFAAGSTCSEVAQHAGVTRQAAGIWRQTLGADVATFTVYADVQAIADKHPRSAP